MMGWKGVQKLNREKEMNKDKPLAPSISLLTALIFGFWQSSFLASAFMFSFMMGMMVIVNEGRK